MHIDEAALDRLATDLGVRRDDLPSDELSRLTAYLLGIPFVELKNRKLDFATLSLIPEAVSRNHNVIAFNKNGDSLEVALLDIEDLKAVAFLKKKLGLKILPRLTTGESVKWALLSYQHALKSEFGDLIEREAAKLKDEGIAPGLADLLLKHALIQGASDIHVEPGEDHSLVRYRIGTLLHDAMILPARALSAVVRTLRHLAGGDASPEGRFRLETGSENVLIRFSVLPLHSGERLAIRLVRGSASGFTLEGLGLEAEAVEELHRHLFSGPGLVLVTGPARSGKTTALYTMLDLLNSPATNILTIEDEIEFALPRVGQSRVKNETGFTYAHGLRTLLRQDPDVIMVGNVADAETASLLAHAARRHLVLASLEADSVEAALGKFSSLAGAAHHLKPLKMVLFHAPPAVAGIKRVVLGPSMLQSLHEEADPRR